MLCRLLLLLLIHVVFYCSLRLAQICLASTLVIGVSLSEQVEQWIYIYICHTCVRRSVNASWHSFNRKHCAHWSVYRKQTCKGSKTRALSFQRFRLHWVLLNMDTQNSSRRAPKSAQEQEHQWWHRKRQSLTCCRDNGTKEWKVEKAEGEGPHQMCYSNC